MVEDLVVDPLDLVHDAAVEHPGRVDARPGRGLEQVDARAGSVLQPAYPRHLEAQQGADPVVHHPPLLVCDEPTGNLDPDTSVGIMQLLYRINRAGTTILMVTHDREMVDKMRKRVIQLEDGRLARDERRGGYVGE